MHPTRLGPYTIRSRLGRGGMGTVFEAVDGEGSVVAVKTLTAQLGDDEGMRRRFTAEIEALKGLRHPGIVRLLAFGEDEGRPFFAMELVRGQSLEQLLRAGRRFGWREAASIASEVARALKVAHDQGIVHRDLKPANLLFPEQPGTAGSVRLADFGIARLFGDSGHTQAGTVVGTAEYMAPEQAAGDVVDHRADLYALGLVMFAMLTGRSPFRGGKVTEVLHRQRWQTPPRVSAIVPEIPAPLDALIERLLAKNPAERPASALAVGRALEAILAAPAASSATLTGDPTAAVRRTNDTLAAEDSAPDRLDHVDLLAATRATADGVPMGVTRPSGRPEVDADTVTQDFVTGAAAGTSESPAALSLAHQATEPDVAGAGQAAVARSRFTTVEAMDRLLREEADRTARRDRVVRSVVAAGLLALVAAGGWLVLAPVTADQLHERIMAVANDPAADLRDARAAIDLFLSRFPADGRSSRIRQLEHQLAVDALERRSRRRPRDDEALLPLERDYRAAMAREDESPLACLAALEAILALHADAAGDEPVSDASAEADDPAVWLSLVRRQIDRIAPAARREKNEDVARAATTLAEAAALAEEAEAAPAERAELLDRRRALLEGLVEIYRDRPHVAAAVAEARRLLSRND